MVWIANADLAASVSNAGGLGLISPFVGLDEGDDQVEGFKTQIRKARSLTSKPFGVNLPLQNPLAAELIEAVISEKVAIVITAAGNPATYTGRLKEAGITVFHVIASVKHALGAEKRGVDGVIAEGFEAGGHNGFDELPTFVLIPQVADAVKIPVVAAGGIADARGLVAALALGAEGVQMGTRFVATTECIAHSNFKEAIVRADDTSTVITDRKIGPTRILKNPVAEKLLEMEAQGASTEDMIAYIGLESRSRAGELEGDMITGEAYCDAIAGMITQVLSVNDVIRSFVDDFDKIVATLK
jgi:enoyl-[acyl-carrier protein] reductase II